LRNFQYTARNARGKAFKGDIQTDSRNEALQKLREQGLYVTRLTEEGAETGRSGVYRIKTKEIAFFCRQMSTMLSAGLTVLRSIDILYNRADKPRLKRIYLRLYEDIQKGLSLTDAFREQEGSFPVLLVNMVQAGEMSGSLDRVMGRMAEHYEKENKLMNKVRTSMVYPIILLVVTFAVMIALFVFVLPQFFKMFEGAQLPAITRGVMAISNFLINRWYVAVLVVLFIILGVTLLKQQPGVRRRMDRRKLYFPIIGKLNRTIYVSRFTNSMSILYSSGITMIDAVNIAVSVLNNTYVSSQFLTVVQDIEQGAMLSSSIEKTGLFDPMVTSVIYVGEESGSLDVMLAKLSDFYDEEAQTAMQKMVALLEPLMMILIAIIIGVVVAAVLLPIYSMYGTIL